MIHDEAGEFTGEDQQRTDDEIVGCQLVRDCSTEYGVDPAMYYIEAM